MLAAVALLCLVVAQAQGPWTSAKYLAGGVPALPRQAVGGGQVILELAVDEGGSVTGVKPLRTTPPFAASLIGEAQGWRFSPAEEERVDSARPSAPATKVAVPSNVALIGMYRPPVLRGPTLGALPKDVGSASEDIAFPLTMVMPNFPPTARAGGSVLVEARIGTDGSVGDVKILQAQPPFESAALNALAQWTFRPARRAGVPVPSQIYIVFGFAQIVGNK